MNHRWIPAIALLLIAWALLLTTLDAQSLSAAEAQYANAVYDVRDAPSLVDDPRAWLRYVRDSLRTAADRVESSSPVTLGYTLLLDAWAILSGDSETSLRLISAFAGLLTIAATYSVWAAIRQNALYLGAALLMTGIVWMLRDAVPALLLIALVTLPLAIIVRWQRGRRLARVAWLVVLLVSGYSVFLQQTAPVHQHLAWRETVAEAAGFRSPLEPALVDVPVSHPLAYYSRRYDLNGGIIVRYGWREFTDDAFAILIDSVRAQPQTWLIAPRDAPRSRQAAAALGAGRTIGYETTLGDMRLVRFDASDATPE